jgi:hypothetical protein
LNITHEPAYVVKLAELLWGLLLLAVTMAVHGVGMLGTLRLTRAFERRFKNPGRFAPALGRVVLGAWIITSVHLFEVLLWALFIVWKGALSNPGLAYYVALMNYTTLGSEYDLAPTWRLLEGMNGIAGLMTFAWSTGVLVTFAQSFEDSVLGNRARRWLEPVPPSPPAEVAPPAILEK